MSSSMLSQASTSRHSNVQTHFARYLSLSPFEKIASAGNQSEYRIIYPVSAGSNVDRCQKVCTEYSTVSNTYLIETLEAPGCLPPALRAQGTPHSTPGPVNQNLT